MSYNRLFEKVSLFYKLARYGNRSAYLKAMGQASLSGPPMPTPGSPGTPGARPMTMREVFQGHVDQPTPTIPTVNVEDLPKAPQEGHYMLPIAKETQNQLSDLLMPKGLIPVKLVDDGKIGDKTRQALTAFKQHYNLPATPQNIKDTWLKERNPGLVTKAPF